MKNRTDHLLPNPVILTCYRQSSKHPRGKGKGYKGDATEPVASCFVSPGTAVEFFVDTTFNGKSFRSNGSARNPVGGKQSNVLFADGVATTTISAWAHVYSPTTKDTQPISNLAVTARIADPSQGSLLDGLDAATAVTGTTDTDGWAQFTFRAAPSSAATTGGNTSDARVDITVGADSSPVVLSSTDVFSYGTFDFRNLPVTLENVSLSGLTAFQIYGVFFNYGADKPLGPSFLASLFFKGRDAFIDTNGNCSITSIDCAFEAGDAWYTATACPACDLYSSQPTVSAAQEFANVAQEHQTSAFLLLLMAEREQHLLTKDELPDASVLDWAMGYGDRSRLRDQVENAAAALGRFRAEPTYPVNSYPPGSVLDVAVPTDSPFFFPSYDVPISQYPAGFTKMIGLASGQCGFPDDVISRYNVAFETPNRANYVLWRFNSWIQACREGGGNRIAIPILNRLHGLLGQ